MRPVRLLFAFVPLLLFSCDEAPPQKVASAPVPATSPAPAPADSATVTAIGSSGFSVRLPQNMKVEKDPRNNAWYISFKDENSDRGEGGIYIGTKPATYPPTDDYTKKDYPGLFLNQPLNWTEYTTATYVQREVFINENDSVKIHAWYYSKNPTELEQLRGIMETISR